MAEKLNDFGDMKLHEPWREVEALKAEAAKLRHRNSELESENARLRAELENPMIVIVRGHASAEELAKLKEQWPMPPVEVDHG